MELAQARALGGTSMSTRSPEQRQFFFHWRAWQGVFPCSSRGRLPGVDTATTRCVGRGAPPASLWCGHENGLLRIAAPSWTALCWPDELTEWGPRGNGESPAGFDGRLGRARSRLQPWDPGNAMPRKSCGRGGNSPARTFFSSSGGEEVRSGANTSAFRRGRSGSARRTGKSQGCITLVRSIEQPMQAIAIARQLKRG